MQRCFTNILSANVEKAATFYENILHLQRHFDSDWFVILTHDSLHGMELGILQRDNDIVPAAVRNAPAGIMVTFVLDDCDVIFERARKFGAEILEQPTDMPYGQRRMLLRDVDGTVVDISSPTPA